MDPTGVTIVDPRFAGRGEEYRVAAIRAKEEELRELERMEQDGDFRWAGRRAGLQTGSGAG